MSHPRVEGGARVFHGGNSAGGHTATPEERAAQVMALARDLAPRLTREFGARDHGDLLYDDQGSAGVIVDASALIAILRQELDADRYNDAIAAALTPKFSAANYLVAAIVVDSTRDPVATMRFDQIVVVAGLAVVPVTGSQATPARAAYRELWQGQRTSVRSR